MNKLALLVFDEGTGTGNKSVAGADNCSSPLLETTSSKQNHERLLPSISDCK
jgi:hypothetical protein